MSICHRHWLNKLSRNMGNRLKLSPWQSINGDEYKVHVNGQVFCDQAWCTNMPPSSITSEETDGNLWSVAQTSRFAVLPTTVCFKCSINCSNVIKRTHHKMCIESTYLVYGKPLHYIFMFYMYVLIHSVHVLHVNGVNNLNELSREWKMNVHCINQNCLLQLEIMEDHLTSSY